MTGAAAAANAAASLALASSSLTRHRSAARLLLLCRTGNPRPTARQSRTADTILRGPSPLFHRPLVLARSPDLPAPRWRLFCNRTLSADAVACEKPAAEAGKRIREFRKRLRIVDVKGGPDEGMDRLGQALAIRGWVRTCRVQSSVTFIELNDGSCLSNLQCVMNIDAEGYDQVESGAVTTGASVLVEGIVVSSQGSKQKVELKVARLVTIGKSDPLTYPIQKKRATREFLRTIAHLRPRTNTFGAVTRVRNTLAYATHKFFQENGFVWISSPIITASDCEGAGEQFCVTTLIPNTREGTDCLVNTIPTSKDGKIDWSQMIEPELAFADLNDDMACATAYLQYVVKYILENCKEDMDFFNTWIEKGIINRLNDVVEKDFVQLTYSDAVELLLGAKKKFEFPVKWGLDLQSEHERYITEVAFAGRPVIIRDYPKEIKAFYMRQNDDGKTVAAMDLLVPRVGELIGGSQREERLEYLGSRLEELNLNKDSYWWYLDLRRFGSVPHAGFGLGFERLVQFATGIENIRDAIPFPRAPGSADF
ncbi:asparagine--tRNA ligase, chloroplastic/mitochondrial isoform X2 [Phoenix dactylifera]|uniref:Asparagine--tRNA ligase, chloroplastic/mitochondrial isoform X2 n=1 Tax=Phoenix dactylifera TaxID=42345 RepID=A0A8B8J6Y1_PHODC|nr:asparagine--tRNA ligase, chloroplastic/mitochondrial isoform X2 [Phoenix dactylifera]